MLEWKVGCEGPVSEWRGVSEWKVGCEGPVSGSVGVEGGV